VKLEGSTAFGFSEDGEKRSFEGIRQMISLRGIGAASR